MNEIVRSTFRSTIGFLRSELAVMPLGRWNESVLRYHFCRVLATEHPEVEQHLECRRIDLVLRQPPGVAFIEFKFFIRPRRFDPYTGIASGCKGGPGRKNLAEFRECIDQLHARRSTPGLSKYVLLVYADPAITGRQGPSYSHQYDEYHHPRGDASVTLLESSERIDSTEGTARAQLYEVACRDASDAAEPPAKLLRPSAAGALMSRRG